MNRAVFRTLAAGALLSVSAFTAAAGPLSLDPRIVAAVPGVTQVQYQPQYGAPQYQYPAPQYQQYPQQQYAPQHPQQQYPQPQYQQPQYQAPQVQAPQAARPEPARVQQANAQPGTMGGGFIEFLFGGANQGRPQIQQPEHAPQADPTATDPREPAEQEERRPGAMASASTPSSRPEGPEAARPAINPKFLPQVVNYTGPEKPGTIVIDTRVKHLFFVQENGKAMRYGVGVGRPGFLWAGVKQVTRKREWPDWTPPPEMIERRPDLPRHMEGGPENPLGARAMYLGSTLYRIHGSNEPWTIGMNVSSGCIRMRNEDVIDLYGRVKVGTKVVVI